MDLSKKIREFEESCLSLASTDCEKIKEEINSEIEEQIKVEIADYITRKEWSFKKSIEKLEKNYMKAIFLCQTECKKEILKARDKVELDLRKNVINKLEEYVEKPEYKDYLLNSISKVSKDVENFEIGITSRDYNKYKDELKNKGFENVIEIDNSYIGGCILKTNTIYIDNTLLNNLNEKMRIEKE